MQPPKSGPLLSAALLTFVAACDNSQDIFQEALEAINSGSVENVDSVLHQSYRHSITESSLSKVKADFGQLEFSGGLFDRPPVGHNALSVPEGFVWSASMGFCENNGNEFSFSYFVEGEEEQQGVIVFTTTSHRHDKICGIRIFRKN